MYIAPYYRGIKINIKNSKGVFQARRPNFPLWYLLLLPLWESVIVLCSIYNCEYDQEIPHSQTADNTVAPRGRAAQPSQDTRKTNLAKQPALSSPSSDCNN